jgi:hypothetical protein
MDIVLAPVCAPYQQQRYALNPKSVHGQNNPISDYYRSMLQASAKPPRQPRRTLAAQSAILTLVIAACAFAPRAGQAAIYLPLAPVRHPQALDWALAHGASVMGSGPAGGLILGQTPPGLMLRAAAEGTLVLAVPSFLCRQPES